MKSKENKNSIIIKDGWIVDTEERTALIEYVGFKAEIYIDPSTKEIVVDSENNSVTPHGSYITTNIPVWVMKIIMSA